MFDIEPYRHFKNYPYLRICEMTVPGQKDKLVLYRCLNEDRLYCRSAANFHGEVVTKTYSGRRFEKTDGYKAEIEREYKRLSDAQTLDVLHSETGLMYKVRIDQAKGTAVGSPLPRAQAAPAPA
jgi:hypothetical protein